MWTNSLPVSRCVLVVVIVLLRLIWFLVFSVNCETNRSSQKLNGNIKEIVCIFHAIQSRYGICTILLGRIHARIVHCDGLLEKSHPKVVAHEVMALGILLQVRTNYLAQPSIRFETKTYQI